MSGGRVLAALAALVLAGVPSLAAAADASGETIEGLPASAPVQADAPLVLPARPGSAQALVPVQMVSVGALSFGIDPSSVQAADAHVVRYTLVARSRSGYTNIGYEALDCARDAWHVYATWSEANGRWTPNRDTEAWLRITPSDVRDVHAVLDSQYFCQDRNVAGNAAALLSSLRRGLRGAPKAPLLP